MKFIFTAILSLLGTSQIALADCPDPTVRFGCVCDMYQMGEGWVPTFYFRYKKFNLENGTAEIIREFESWESDWEGKGKCEQAKAAEAICQI